MTLICLSVNNALDHHLIIQGMRFKHIGILVYIHIKENGVIWLRFDVETGDMAHGRVTDRNDSVNTLRKLEKIKQQHGLYLAT